MQRDRISDLEAAMTDKQEGWTPSHSRGNKSAWNRTPGPQPVSATPSHLLQFRISGIPEGLEESDRDLGKQITSILTDTLEKNPTYATKQTDKVQFKIVSARRMGSKADTSRPRLALITVDSHFDATSIIRNRKFLKDSGVAALDFLSPQEHAKYKENLQAFLDVRRDKTKWVSFTRGELIVKDKVPAEGTITNEK